jgi:predicted dehydrogenase
MVPARGVFLNEEEQGGGPLIDIGTHALDMTLWMMNNYRPKIILRSAYKKFAKQTETGNLFGGLESCQIYHRGFGFRLP